MCDGTHAGRGMFPSKPEGNIDEFEKLVVGTQSRVPFVVKLLC